jgi:hypothetical protein
VTLRYTFRFARLVLAAAALFACADAAWAAPMPARAGAVPAGPGSLTGVWQSGGTTVQRDGDPARVQNLASGRTPERDRVLKTIDGGWPPLQPWASELLEKRIGMSQRGDPEGTGTALCLPGVPLLMLGGPYPIQIIESPGLVTILLEEHNHFRLVYLNGKHAEDPDPTFLGDSIGHWEGDTLVVDTVGLSGRAPIDRVGIPHSDELHLVERFRRTGPDTMELLLTIDDPKAFTRPWDARVRYRAPAAGVHMTEYICENNRDYP